MLDPSELDKVLKRAEHDCYSKIPQTGKNYCNLLFDGLMCWQPTPPGVLAVQNCSNKYIKSLNNNLASKYCGTDGEWFRDENSTRFWTNYTQCGSFYIEKQIVNTSVLTNHTIYNQWIPIIKSVTECGYILSTISLIIALFIFIHFKRLHCPRNKLHINLFASFVLRAFMSLVKDGLFVKGTALPHEINYVKGEPVFNKSDYSWICKAIISLWNYFILSNYTFLLMEGVYLHNLLFFKLFSENGVAIYYCLGWSLPFIFIVPWIIFKAKTENIYCWTTKSSKYIAMLIDLPIGLTVIMNFVLFTIIMRILFVKLTSMYVQQRWTKYQKLVRAILILVPLFGVPYTISFVLSFYVTQNQTLEILWLFFDQTFTAFQGLFASLVYCFMNNDVQVEIARKYKSFKDKNRGLKRRSRTISHTTQIPLTEDLPEYPHLVKDQKTSDYF